MPRPGQVNMNGVSGTMEKSTFNNNMSTRFLKSMGKVDYAAEKQGKPAENINRNNNTNRNNSTGAEKAIKSAYSAVKTMMANTFVNRKV
jgi:hypothetical protein